MKHRIFTLCLTLAALTLAPMAAQAQTTAKDLVPMKGTVTSDEGGGSFLIPFDPPILVGWGTSKGQAELLGQTFAVTHVGYSVTTLGVAGTPLSTDGLNVFTYPDGSAAFVRTIGIIRPSSTAGFLTTEGTWTMTGGRGMFLGASGSGIWSSEREIATGKSTASWQGANVMPNVKKQ
jgi:hypothetical protein